MYPLGPSVFNLDYTQLAAGLPSQLSIETPAQWVVAAPSDPVVLAHPAFSAGALKNNGVFTAGTTFGGALTNYVTTPCSDGNDGDCEWIIPFLVDSNTQPATNRYYLPFSLEDGFEPASAGGSGVNYGITFVLQNFGPQSDQQYRPTGLSINGTGSPFPLLTPTPNTRGLHTDRVYELHILKWRNTIRVGIKDVALGYYLAGASDTSSTGDAIALSQTSGGVTYTLTYYQHFHSVYEIQHDFLMGPTRVGLRPYTLTGSNIYIGAMSWKPWAEFWWPKNLGPLDPVNLPAEPYTPTSIRALWSGTLGPISTLTGVSQTTIQVTAKAAINGTGVTYQWQTCSTPGGTFTNVAGQTGLVLNASALTANTLYYFQLVATGTDSQGIVRVVTYPQCAFRTLNTARAAKSIYIDSAQGTNGTGTIGSPLNSLANFYAAFGANSLVPGDNIILVSGAGHASYAGTLTLFDATGLPSSPITVTSSDTANPAKIVNYGGQYGSGSTIQAINTHWLLITDVLINGAGIKQLPGSGANFEAQGSTIVGAGTLATRTSTAGCGVLFSSSVMCWNSGMVSKYPSSINSYTYSEIDEPHLIHDQYNGGDTMWNHMQGNMVNNVTIDGMYQGIMLMAPGTHEDIGVAGSITVSGQNQVTPYQIRNRAGQEFAAVMNSTVRNCPQTGIWAWAEPTHRDPTPGRANDIAGGGSLGIDPVNDPYVYDPTVGTPTDPYATALYGGGTIITLHAYNAGPTAHYTTNGGNFLQSLSDHPVMPHHRNLIMLNNSLTNFPGDSFYSSIGTPYPGDIYNSGNGYGALQYKGMPAGQSGFCMNVCATNGVLASKADASYNGRTDGGSFGPIGFLIFNSLNTWVERFFIHDSVAAGGDGCAIDNDAAIRCSVWKNCILINNKGGVEITGYPPNRPCYNGLFDHIVSLDWGFGAGQAFNILAGFHTRMTFLNCTFLDSNPSTNNLYNGGTLSLINSIFLANGAAPWDSSASYPDNSLKRHVVFGSYIYNYDAAGVTANNTRIFKDSSCHVSVNPQLTNLLAGSAAFNYPRLVPNTNGTNAPTTVGYGYDWAVSKLAAMLTPAGTLTGGVDPTTLGVRRPASVRSDITGASISPTAFPVGALGVGVGLAPFVSPALAGNFTKLNGGMEG